jgi:hypothetical protein
MLVSIIGLAFIVTVAAFLVATSNDQDIARLASAKVDIATREDALMREILQQTATGMLPGTDGFTGPILTWTQIMTNAATNLHAISYVDPAELAALPGLAGVIPANMGDTGGTLLGIFQGYNQEVPFGGTSGLADLVPVDNGTPVEPPLMNWSANATLSSATALTTPQEFFLGSQYTAGITASVTKLSVSNRWGQIIYPAIRFGYKQPGDQFIARRAWWRIPLVYQTTQQIREYQVGVVGGPASVNLYPSAPANYVLSAYEIPSQLPISGNANLQIGLNADGTAWGNGIQVTGSIYGGQIQLYGGTYHGVSSRQAVTVNNPATVNGVAYADSTDSAFDQPGTRENMALTQKAGGAAPVSVAGNDGKVLLVPVMPGNEFYMSVATPTHWDLYARPYYRCRIRIIISNTSSTLIYNSLTGVTNPSPAGVITVDVYTLSDTASPAQPDQILGFQDSAATHTTYAQGYSGDTTGNGNPSQIWPTGPSWMTYTSTGTGTGPAPTGSDRNLLVIDVLKMVQTLGGGTLAQVAPQLYSIYIGSNPTTEPAAPYTSSDPGIAITDTSDLSLFTSGLSIVTNQTLYLLDWFNQVNMTTTAILPPTSIYAPQVRYGMSGAIANVALTGQLSVDATSSGTPAVNPLSLTNASGTPIPATSVSANFTEITDPTKIPPITRMTLMFTIEKERAN